MNNLWRERFQWLIFFGFLLPLIAVGCATGTGVKPPQPASTPDRIHVTRFITIPGTQLPPFETTITDRTRVRSLYQAIQALPKFPANQVFNCPADNGIKYHLDFFQGNALLLQATLDASGCRALHLSTHDVRQTNTAFFSLLAREIGVPPARL
jgi:hypothetical protein